MLPSDDEEGLQAVDLLAMSASQETMEDDTVRRRPAAATQTRKRPAASSTQPAKRPPARLHGKAIAACKGCPSLPQDLQQLIPTPLPCTMNVDFAEIFSPPRIVPYIVQRGGRASMSFDLMTGCDLEQNAEVAKVFGYLRLHRPRCVMLSPPCTVFSTMQNMNWGRMSDEAKEEKMRIGVRLLDVAVWIATEQVNNNRFYIIEHPRGAASWKRPNVVALKKLAPTFMTDFDQCTVGLVDTDTKKPIKKPTRLLTNLGAMHLELRDRKCEGFHKQHQRCLGRDSHGDRAARAAKYPPAMCVAIADAVMANA
jgi:hypothetical protein